MKGQAFVFDPGLVDRFAVQCLTNGTRMRNLNEHTQVAAVCAMAAKYTGEQIAYLTGVPERQVSRILKDHKGASC